MRTVQAEDEIAAAGAALGASFGGALGVTATSGPGLALKGETLGLAVMTELPLVVIDVQRAGPSTGMPTKTEQSDLLMALYGRHGEAPMPVLAARTPGDCFEAAYEAARIAVEHMTPVLLLSDGYLGNGSEPWPVPGRLRAPPDHGAHGDARDGPDGGRGVPAVRPRRGDAGAAVGAARHGRPGAPHRRHREGRPHGRRQLRPGQPPAHDRPARREGRAASRGASAPVEVEGDAEGDVLVVGWGSTYGAITSAVRLRARARAALRVGPRPPAVAQPVPATASREALGRFRHVLVPELNDGQLVRLLRAEFLVDARGLSKVQGLPFKAREIEAAILGTGDGDLGTGRMRPPHLYCPAPALTGFQ